VVFDTQIAGSVWPEVFSCASDMCGCGGRAPDGSTRLRQTSLVSVPETLYAETSAGRVAYQVVGAGPPDVVATMPGFAPVDLMWDEPRSVRFLNGLSSFSRHIWFGPPGNWGIGLDRTGGTPGD
jgi:hypothetical protein